jgi:hypothetical protein
LLPGFFADVGGSIVLAPPLPPAFTPVFTTVAILRALRNITFVYVAREDRILAAVNAGQPDAWSCWLTRRLALAVLERTADYLATRSDLAQKAPADFRGETIAFERDAAIAKTARAMSVTPNSILQSSASAAELAERLTISQQSGGFRLELHGQGAEGTAGLVKRDELQRILQMLQVEVAKAGWLGAPARSQAAPAAAMADPKPFRN